ncbi:MAG: hypothetical protein AB7J30_00950 [Hyphomicrobium sp.]|uniref:hypothetical protein n=1 Tax=Hyphomicrobium sp. TaxID=82 RepID=UPI003D134A03
MLLPPQRPLADALLTGLLPPPQILALPLRAGQLLPTLPLDFANTPRSLVEGEVLRGVRIGVGHAGRIVVGVVLDILVVALTLVRRLLLLLLLLPLLLPLSRLLLVRLLRGRLALLGLLLLLLALLLLGLLLLTLALLLLALALHVLLLLPALSIAVIGPVAVAVSVPVFGMAGCAHSEHTGECEQRTTNEEGPDSEPQERHEAPRNHECLPMSGSQQHVL